MKRGEAQGGQMSAPGPSARLAWFLRKSSPFWVAFSTGLGAPEGASVHSRAPYSPRGIGQRLAYRVA